MKKTVFTLFLFTFVFLGKGTPEKDLEDSYQQVEWDDFDENKFVPLRERKVPGCYGKPHLTRLAASNDLASETFFELDSDDIVFSAKQGSCAISLSLLEEGVEAPVSLHISDPRWNNIRGAFIDNASENLMLTTQQTHYFEASVVTVLKRFIFNPRVLLLAERAPWKEGEAEPVMYYAVKGE